MNPMRITFSGEANDVNVDNIVKSFYNRMATGYKKYGVTTERTDIDLLGWLQHLQEELMDACVYVERIKSELKDKQDDGK
tara:strand:- start:285 stop:524 length:240 start_codon:yes stop_codon:yes gene_type:complete